MDGKLFRKTPKKKNSKHSLLTLSSLQGWYQVCTLQDLCFKTFKYFDIFILLAIFYQESTIMSYKLHPEMATIPGL